MAAVRDSKYGLGGLSTSDISAQLEEIQNLKKLFKHPEKIFSKLKVYSLLQNAKLSLENRTPDIKFLYTYGVSLVGFLGKDKTLDSEILYQVEVILGKLKDEKLTDEILMKLWSRLREASLGYPDGILYASKSTLERTVLEWVVDASDNRMELLSILSADSPKLFQTLTSIFYEVLAKTRAHTRVFEVTSLFVKKVKHECEKKGKSSLLLYPKGCRRLVLLMRCPQELCLEGSGNVAKEVLELLLEMFLTDRKRTLIILSHFTEWVSLFKAHLGRSDILTLRL